MFYYKSYPTKRQDLFFILLILFGSLSIYIKSVQHKGKANVINDVAALLPNTDGPDFMAEGLLENAEFFAPGIAATLSSATQTFNGDSPGCTKIRFVVRVLNTSTNGEAINNITIDIGPDVTLGDFLGGDIDLNGQLDVGEVWAYEAFKPITETDMLAGEVFHQAHVEANVVGLGGLVSDDSHPTDVNLDEPTLTKISDCVKGISLIKTGISKNPLGEDGGCASINYTFQVSHTGSPTEMFGTIVITDPMLENENIPINGPIDGDFGTPDLLEPGETWIYQANYPINGDDLINGFVENQAYVEAKTFIVPGRIASDISDFASIDEDRPTRTDIPQCQPLISLIQTGVAKDGFGQDGGCDFIEYTFTVTNESDPNNGQGQVLKDILLEDSFLPLPDILEGPIGDINDDLLMDPGEVWTYQASYKVTAVDIWTGQVETQSQVIASIVEGPQISIVDLSDFEDPTLDRKTVVSLSHCPRIGVIKEGTVSPDCSTIDYIFTVTNESIESLILENVVLTDPKLPAIDGPTGDDGNGLLEKGETWTYTSSYNITPEDINAGQMDNQAMATADVFTYPGLTTLDLSDDDSVLENQVTSTDLTACQTPTIGLIKQGLLIDDDADGCFDSIDFTFTVTNIGNVDLQNIVLNDPLLGGDIPGPIAGTDDGQDGILSIDESWTYEATYILQQMDIDNGFVENQAAVSAESVGLNTPVSDFSDDDSLLEDQITNTALPADLCAPAPSIGVIKVGQALDTDVDDCIDSIEYTFTVTNTGNVDLQNIVLNDPMLDGNVPGPVAGTDNGDDGILSIGESWTYEATYELQQSDIDNGFVQNQASATASSIGDNTPVSDDSDDNSLLENDITNTTLPAELCLPAPSIGAIKQGQLIDEDVDGCIDSILFTFTVTNTGNVDLQNIVLNDPLLGGDVPGPVNGTDNGGDGILSVGESWSYEATYTLTDIDKGNGVVNNQATVTASSVGDNTPVADLSDDNSLTEDQLTTVVLPVDLCAPMPDLALIKTGTLVDLNADGCNETILYSFRVLNTGGMDLQSIVVTDPLLGGNINGPIANTDEKNDGILSVGESWNYEILYAITQQDIVMGSVTNQATATGASVGNNQDVSDFSDDDSWLEDDPTNTSVPNDVCTLGGATIGLIKTGALADTNNDECPESILYTFSVTNTGEFELTDVQLTDQQLLGGTIAGPVDGTDNGNDGVLSIGETWTYSATYPISEQDVLNGFVTNQATVTANTIGIVASIFDLSDDDSLDENDMTMTSVPDYMCSTDSGSDEPFEIFSGITPNGDGFNDYFRINGIENYPDNVLKIFNRWGALVYESEGYGIGNNLFYGVSEGKATILKEKTLPSGTYFYVLNFPTDNPGQESYSGYLYINRN